jgi:hypothetical protein
MHSVIGKLILEATLAQNFRSFFSLQFGNMPQNPKLFLTMLEENNLRVPAAFNKCSSTPLQNLI